MFIVGERVKFKRSDGSWSVGWIKESRNEYYIVQWLANNEDLLGERKVHMLHVKKCTRYRLNVLLSIIFIMLFDSFF